MGAYTSPGLSWDCVGHPHCQIMCGALCSVGVSIGIEKHEGWHTVAGEDVSLICLIDRGHPHLCVTLVWVQLLHSFPAVVHECEHNSVSTEM